MFSGFRMGSEATGRKLHYCIQILFRVTKSLVQKLGSPGVENIPIIFKICIILQFPILQYSTDSPIRGPLNEMPNPYEIPKTLNLS